MLTLPIAVLAQRIIDHPDNARALSQAAQGRAGPAEAYIRASPNRLYPAIVLFFTAKSPCSQQTYLADIFGKLYTWEEAPGFLLGISRPNLSHRTGDWKVEQEVA